VGLENHGDGPLRCNDLKIEVESVDYRGIGDPAARVAKLLDTAVRLQGPLVLVGSSMGGHVAAAAAARAQARGLFSFGARVSTCRGFEAHTPQDVSCPTVIVHGWRDDIVPGR